MKKSLVLTLLMVLMVGIGIFWEVGRKAVPLARSEIQHPLYTIGDNSYDIAIQDKKSVVKFGPMFMGIYSGGLAFSSYEEAKRYMKANHWNDSDWNIYQLSGDYQKDAEHGYINKSLLVLRKARAEGIELDNTDLDDMSSESMNLDSMNLERMSTDDNNHNVMATEEIYN